jgi:hypothetical protein
VAAAIPDEIAQHEQLVTLGRDADPHAGHGGEAARIAGRGFPWRRGWLCRGAGKIAAPTEVKNPVALDLMRALKRTTRKYP